MRISSIDIGSNAIRQLIVDVGPTFHWRVLKKERFPIRLGQDVFMAGEIEPETVNRLIAAFTVFAKNNRKFRVKRIAAVATSAMRDAKNSKAVARKIKARSGIQIQIISGNSEANLIQKAVFGTSILSGPKYLFLDLGGGSAEYTFIQKVAKQQTFKRLWSKSFPLGVVRLKLDLAGAKNKMVPIRSKVLRELGKVPKPLTRQKWPTIVGTGGNFDALAKLKLQLLKLTPNTNLKRSELIQIRTKWQKLTDAQKLNLDIRKDRIDVLHIAIELILISMNYFECDQIKIPYTGLKEGVIRHLLEPDHLRSNQI